MITYFLDTALRQVQGLVVSVELTIIPSVIGLVLGFFGGVLLRHRSRWVRYPMIGLVEVLRGFPALLILYIVYYGLPQVDIVLSSMVSAFVAFALTIAGFTAEIFRAAIASVPTGQLEAAKAVGLKPFATTRLVVLPHVLGVAIPPLIGIIVIAFQGTSLAISIGVTELTGVAFQYGQVNFTVLNEIAVAAVLYLIVTSLLIWIEVWAERRADRFSGRRGTGRRGGAANLIISPAILQMGRDQTETSITSMNKKAIN